MTLSLPSLVVSDQACQRNWEVLQIEAAARLVAETALTARVTTLEPLVATHGIRIQEIGTVRSASSTAAQGPGPVGANVIYSPISVTIEEGTWIVYAQATVSSSVADGKQLALADGFTFFEIPATAGPIEGAAAAGAEAMLTTWAVVTRASPTPIKILVKRNGGSALTIGFSGAVLSGEQRITAVKVNNPS